MGSIINNSVFLVRVLFVSDHNTVRQHEYINLFCDNASYSMICDGMRLVNFKWILFGYDPYLLDIQPCTDVFGRARTCLS